MNFGQSFRLAIKSLTSSKMRAILTMLGIIIGVGAVIVILSLGNGLTGMVQQQVDKIGVNMIQVNIWGRGDEYPDPNEMYRLVERHPDVLSGVSPYISVTAAVRKGNDIFSSTHLYGVSEVMYNPTSNCTIDGETLEQGRFITYLDVARREPVCVIGAYLEQEAFRGDALGKSISINGRAFTVVGVLKRSAELEMLEGGRDDQIYLPYESALEIIGGRWVSFYIFSSISGETASAGKRIVGNYLNDFFRVEDGEYSEWYISTMAEEANQINAMMGVAMAVLVAIAAISLLVGGIGIMNIMLVSVTERTREIGIRKSLGAKSRDIRSQFVIEAGTTSAIGGLLGIAFGCLLAKGLETLLGGMLVDSLGASGITFNATPTLGAIDLSFGVSVGIGVLFGYLPANKAAKLNPIDALRYD